MSFCRILSTLCSQVVFHNIPQTGKKAKEERQEGRLSRGEGSKRGRRQEVVGGWKDRKEGCAEEKRGVGGRNMWEAGKTGRMDG
jgi:hypothetical protein